MIRATMSVLGLYSADPQLFSLMQVPAEIDKDVLVDNLLADTAELEIIYPDPDFMKALLASWSAKQVHVWEELYQTTQYVYNPIWNKDGTRTETRDLATGDTYNRGYKDAETRNFAGSAANHTGSNTLNDIYGYNSESAAHESGSQITANSSTSTTDTGTGSHQITENSSRTGTDTGTVTIKEQGNIGVTSTQELIERQRAVVQFNVMDYIIADFKKRFCLMIY